MFAIMTPYTFLVIILINDFFRFIGVINSILTGFISWTFTLLVEVKLGLSIIIVWAQAFLPIIIISLPSLRLLMWFVYSFTLLCHTTTGSSLWWSRFSTWSPMATTLEVILALHFIELCASQATTNIPLCLIIMSFYSFAEINSFFNRYYLGQWQRWLAWWIRINNANFVFIFFIHPLESPRPTCIVSNLVIMD